MIRLTRKSDQAVDTGVSLTLTYDQRIRSRLRVLLDDGREAGIFLERGICLRDGDSLISEDGLAVRVRAGDEALSCVRCDDPLLFARACYHLGNRHVALQIGPGRLSYPHDHVLDAMLRGLGLEVGLEQAPFEPEPGAYGAGHHAHDHRHHHDG
ncbi:urease accessory protein UreE [Imhoffiella purpurea]|uniref:Urease accessory protein UreE n=1 Tax=Imhoffiella purpurea TaxID=1249627 RepID=W9VI82_9GAMM|nr:urease accessory protein UreE [Imhoffiella purpurea]EXJ16731.1 Urease accessory protein UreE [Imhoffiella purpurea]